MEHDVELTNIEDKSSTAWGTYDPNSRTFSQTDQPREQVVVDA
jgi:hypothetical protein